MLKKEDRRQIPTAYKFPLTSIVPEFNLIRPGPFILCSEASRPKNLDIQSSGHEYGTFGKDGLTNM